MADGHETTRRARTFEVIETISIRGKGIDIEDPVREVFQYWTRDGELLAENDPCGPEKLWGQSMDHKERHQFLHKLLDELVADAIAHYPECDEKYHKRFSPSTHTVVQLLHWSHKQCKNPDHPLTERKE